VFREDTHISDLQRQAEVLDSNTAVDALRSGVVEGKAVLNKDRRFNQN
jgi:hypothetical protein